MKIWAIFGNQTEPTKANQQNETFHFIPQQRLYPEFGLSLCPEMTIQYLFKQVGNFVNLGEDNRYIVLLSPHTSVLELSTPKPTSPTAPTERKSISNHLLSNRSFCHSPTIGSISRQPIHSQAMSLLVNDVYLKKIWDVIIRFFE